MLLEDKFLTSHVSIYVPQLPPSHARKSKWSYISNCSKLKASLDVRDNFLIKSEVSLPEMWFKTRWKEEAGRKRSTELETQTLRNHDIIAL